jgi:hypothetical protein
VSIRSATPSPPAPSPAPLNQRIVAIAAMPDGLGYWLVGRDGGVFIFGGAHFYGSLGATPTAIVGIIANANNGYRLIGPAGESHGYGTAS